MTAFCSWDDLLDDYEDMLDHYNDALDRGRLPTFEAAVATTPPLDPDQSQIERFAELQNEANTLGERLEAAMKSNAALRLNDQTRVDAHREYAAPRRTARA